MTIQAAEDIDAQVGEAIHHIVWRRKLSQKELAAHIGVTPTTLSKKMRGQRAWSLSELVAVAGVLGVEYTDLLPRLDSNQQPFD